MLETSRSETGMAIFRNQPQLRDDSGEQKIKRYVHSPLTVEHNGINASITANGKVILAKVVKQVGDEVEYDEIEIPASLVFKLASLLKATRQVKYMSLGELQSDKGKNTADAREQDQESH